MTDAEAADVIQGLIETRAAGIEAEFPLDTRSFHLGVAVGMAGIIGQIEAQVPLVGSDAVVKSAVNTLPAICGYIRHHTRYEGKPNA